jgi:hypothetical protein
MILGQLARAATTAWNGARAFVSLLYREPPGS